jgi:hypothetical protein
MTKNEHDPNPLSDEEKGILSAFRELGVAAEENVPTDLIGSRLLRGTGSLIGGMMWRWESAYISLQIRGYIEPGADPFSAITWTLTPEGYELIHSPGFASREAP